MGDADRQAQMRLGLTVNWFVSVFRSFALASVYGIIAIGISMAGTIVLETEAHYEVEAGEIVWTVRNTGDSLADAVVISAHESTELAVASDRFFLDGGDAVSGRLPLRLPTTKPGSYVVPLRIDYSQATGQRHSTFSWIRYTIGDHPGVDETRVLARLEPPEKVEQRDGFSGEGSLALTVLSFAEEALRLSLTVLLPQGLALTTDPPSTVTLDAGGLGYWEFGITNVSAGEGGIVPVGVLLTYETSDGIHHVSEAMARISLVEEHPLLAEYPPSRLPWGVPLALAVALVMVCLRHARSVCGIAEAGTASPRAWAFDVAVVMALTLYIGLLLNLQLALLDTLCVGGDTPAHHYLAGRIGEAGSIVSWAPGWWSGFPMFRYYFPLPYVAISLLSCVLPHNVAFKFCAIGGLVLLSLTLYLSGRMLRLRRPVPVMLACLAIPLVFDNTHNMWGVNAYSTLAGMIANSWSFALMPLAMASACRDACDGRVRVRTVLLLVAMVLSHFFTSMLAAMVLTVALVGFVVRRLRGYEVRPRWIHEPWAVLVIEGGLTFLLTAWWVLPLVVRRQWSVDFGGAWDIRFFRQLAPAARWLPIGAIITWVVTSFCCRKRVPKDTVWRLWVGVHGALLGLSILFFFAGEWVSPVFVNCRFWPFIIYALLALSALLFADVVQTWRVPMLGTGVLMAMCLAFGWREGGRADDPMWSKANYVPFWAAYNFRGLEALREGHVVRDLADQLVDTPGRMAQDLHPGNEWLGSSRIFEAMPHLAGKSIVEGGIVNSALGSLAAYTVQGEISDQPAGWPLRVKPRTFNPASGLRHLEFMGVRQFVARSRNVQAALAADPGWRALGEFGGGKWRLFESTLPSASPVRVWKHPLRAFCSKDPQGDLLAWMYEPAAVVEPMLLVLAGATMPDGVVVESSEAYHKALAELAGAPPSAGWLDVYSDAIDDYSLGVDGTLRFHTQALGKPHILAMSYDPAWRVTGADAVCFVTPGYCAVVPTQEDVELRFGKGISERVGEGLGVAGVLALGGIFWVRIREQRLRR